MFLCSLYSPILPAYFNSMEQFAPSLSLIAAAACQVHIFSSEYVRGSGIFEQKTVVTKTACRTQLELKRCFPRNRWRSRTYTRRKHSCFWCNRFGSISHISNQCEKKVFHSGPDCIRCREVMSQVHQTIFANYQRSIVSVGTLRNRPGRRRQCISCTRHVGTKMYACCRYRRQNETFVFAWSPAFLSAYCALIPAHENNAGFVSEAKMFLKSSAFLCGLLSDSLSVCSSLWRSGMYMLKELDF